LAATASFAQSSVTLSGGYGVAADKAVSAKAALKQTDGYINFAATEDLGGGLKAGFDAQVAWTGRASTVNAENTNFNLSGGFGKVEFRNVAAGSANLGTLASLSTDVNGILGGDANLNYLRYTAPELYTGLTLQAGSYNAMSAGSLPIGDIGTKAVKTFVKATYVTGPVTVAGDYRTVDGRTRVWAAYDAGVAKVEYAAEVAYDDSSKKKQSEVALTVPAGAWAFGLHYGTKAGQGKGTEVAAVYSLSKRTNVNVSYGSFTGVANTALTGNASRVRLMHTF
jgi:hypothetical protein